MVCYPFFDREKHVICRHSCHVTEVDDTEAISDSKVRKWVWKFKDGYLKHSLGGKRFSDNEEVKEAMNSWLSDQVTDFFEVGFQNLVLRTRGHGVTLLRVKEDIKDVSSELGNGGYRIGEVRTVPFALKGRVENEIDRLEKEGIIEKVDSSEWATPVVPVVKSDGSIRLCADYSATLNPNLIVPQHPLPRLDEIFASDASQLALVVFCHVYPDGSERPIAFASSTLSGSEKNTPKLIKSSFNSLGSKKVLSIFESLKEGKDLQGKAQYTIEDGCIMYGQRVCSSEISEERSGRITFDTLGIVKMKAIARSFVYWKNIDNDIEESRLKTVSIVLDIRLILQNLKFITGNIPGTCQRIMDLSLHPMNFSVIKMELGHKTSAPFKPSSNGQAERYVATLKQSLRAMQNGHRYYTAEIKYIFSIPKS
ncbi:uncharacterized protein K02A2.6 [Trichonephila clavipes]|nr:uncharacterized protein K02A2.6 [Trichonephila clavipes]